MGIMIYFYVCCRRLAHAAGGALAAQLYMGVMTLVTNRRSVMPPPHFVRLKGVEERERETRTLRKIESHHCIVWVLDLIYCTLSVVGAVHYTRH